MRAAAREAERELEGELERDTRRAATVDQKATPTVPTASPMSLPGPAQLQAKCAIQASIRERYGRRPRLPERHEKAHPMKARIWSWDVGSGVSGRGFRAP